MAILHERYGVPPKKANNFYHNWQNIRENCDWESFDAFLFWCSTQEHERGMELRRHDTSQPHGPGNSFWYSRKTAAPECVFCEGCTRTCPNNGNGCDEWKEWFVSNWNKNIRYQKPPAAEPVDDGKRQFFRYEHPDLVKEGIV